MKRISINQMTILCHTVGINIHELPSETPHFFNQNRYIHSGSYDLWRLHKDKLMTCTQPSDLYDGDRRWSATELGKEYVKSFINQKKKQVA